MHLYIPRCEAELCIRLAQPLPAARPLYHKSSAVKRQAQLPEQARHLLHELANPAAALCAILGDRGCWAAQAQPRGLQRGPCSNGFLQACVDKNLVSATILVPRQKKEGTPRALVCDVHAVESCGICSSWSRASALHILLHTFKVAPLSGILLPGSI